MFADTDHAAPSALRAATILELGALWTLAAAVEKELLAALPDDLAGVVEVPLINAIVAPLNAIAWQLLALDAATDGDLLIQAKARQHVHGSMA